VRDTTVPLFTPNVFYDTTYVQTQYSRMVSAVDNDDDQLAYNKISGPAALTVDKNYGIVEWKPTAIDTGLMLVLIGAVDHFGNSDTLNLFIQVLPRWPRTYRIPRTGDTGFSVIQTSDGNYAVCGTVGDSAFFMETDTSGNRLIFRTYGSTTVGRALLARCIREIPANQGGGFIICGTDTSAGPQSQLFLMRITPAGDSSWVRRYAPTTLPAPFNQFSSSTGASVCVAGTGNIIVACGSITNGGGASSLLSAMYAVQVDGATGTKVWEKAYYTGPITSGSASAGYSIQQTIQKGFILSGEINQGNIGTGVYLVRTGGTGDSTWTKSFRFTTGTGARNAGNAVNEALDESGFFVCGYTYSSLVMGYSALIFKTSEMGDTVGMWRQTIAGAVGTGVRSTQDGGCIASGYRISGSYGLNDAALWKMTAAGSPYFATMYGTTNNDRAYDAAPTTPDGGYVFTGFSLDPGSGSLDNDIYLVKTDPRGAVTK
jgi:hypothetical protein